MRSRRAGLVAVLLLVGPGSWAVAQEARWFDLYDEAIKHIAQQEWQEAETKLLQARKDGPPSGRAVLRYGSLRPPFFPEYYLGIVYQATGRSQEALQQFQLARKANIDSRNAEFRTITIFEGMAKTSMANAAKLPKPPEKTAPAAQNAAAVSAPTGAGTTSNSAPKEPPPPVVVAPNFARQVADLLGTAQSQLAQRSFDAAERTATSARDLAAKQNLAGELARADQFMREIRGGRASARIEDSLSKREAPTARRELDALVADLPEYGVATLRTRVEGLERELRGVELQRSAMRAFFGGNYQQSLKLLSEAETLGALTARGHFYRACSLAAQAAATENPARDRRLVEARRSYGTAARDSQQFSQDLRYISPKIRQLLGIS
ncbi:MAG: hypothetical protein ACT4QD_07845 [Acidobacteriota bacterium]